MNVLPPDRASHTGEIQLDAEPDVVFTMMCPVREVEWVPDWDPKVVYAVSGLVEPSCVFITVEDEAEAIWYVADHDPARHYLRLIKVLPGEALTEIIIELEAAEGGTRARATYTMTSIGPGGRRRVRDFTEEAHAGRMELWSSALGHYLGKGKRLDDLEHGYE